MEAFLIRTRFTADKSLTFLLYDLATGEDDARLCRDIPEEQCREQPKSFLLQALAQAFSKTGDSLADSKIVLPWLFGVVGAPLFLLGLLVPIRESLALLPQVLIGGIIRRFPVRKWFWITSSVVEGACVILMGVVAAAGARGAIAGWAIIGLLVVFSLARGVASIAAKDTLGKTVSKGRRGRVGGYASTVSGLVASAVGVYLVLAPVGARPDWLLYAVVVAAGISWLLAAATFSLITEVPGATDGDRSIRDLVRDQGLLLFKDTELQKFLIARTLMISTALVGPIYVSLAQRQSGLSLDGLGWLVLSAGLAGAVSSAFWGRLSDRTSRFTMAASAAVSGALGVFVLAALNLVPELTRHIGFYAAVLFILGIAHSGARIGRKTHIVDLAGGDRKAEYVALSNTIIGLLLLAIGGLVGVILQFGLEAGLAILSAGAFAGAVVSTKMKPVQEAAR